MYTFCVHLSSRFSLYMFENRKQPKMFEYKEVLLTSCESTHMTTSDSCKFLEHFYLQPHLYDYIVNLFSNICPANCLSVCPSLGNGSLLYFLPWLIFGTSMELTMDMNPDDLSSVRNMFGCSVAHWTFGYSCPGPRFFPLQFPRLQYLMYLVHI